MSLPEPRWERHGGHAVYRGDLWEVAGVRGGKARTCYALAKECIRTGRQGLVTAGSRQSPQINIVAQIGNALALPVRAYCPEGVLGPELELAREAGAEIVQVKAGYNSVIRARARDYAIVRNWQHVPFGMECEEALRSADHGIDTMPLDALGPDGVLVVPVGSGMTLAAILHAQERTPYAGELPIRAVLVGADPAKRLRTWAPPTYSWYPLEYVRSAYDYHTHAPPWMQTYFEGVMLDPVYEAKCVPWMNEGDALWIVGVRQAVAP